MKTSTLLIIAVAYYLYTQSPAQRLKTAQAAASPSLPQNQVSTIDVSNQLAGLVIPVTDLPVYSPPAVQYIAGSDTAN